MVSAAQSYSVAWLQVLAVSALLILALRPMVRYVILRPEKASEGIWERAYLTIYELLVAVITIAAMLVILPLSLLVSLAMPKRRVLLHRMGRFWTRVFLWLVCVRVRIEGKENLPQGPTIFVQDFSTYLDGAATLVSLPADFRFVFQRHLFEIPVLGWLERAMGYLALETEVVSVMHDDALEILKVLNQGGSIVTSTEGKEVRSGAAFFALRSKLPVVPLVHVRSYTSSEVGAFFTKPFPYGISIKVGKPIKAAEAADDHRHRQELKGKIQAGLADLSGI